jgi:hypothetical protein
MNDPEAANVKIRLDWSKLLGFDQIKQVERGELRVTDLGFSKIGTKGCRAKPQPDA